MKREILFRGKTQYGEWVEGSYLQTDDNTNNPMQHRPLNLRHQIWSYWSGDWNMGGWDPMDVLPETVSQFTGLTDKNGVKIFEGDIVKWTFGKHYWEAIIQGVPNSQSINLYAIETFHNCTKDIETEEYTYERSDSRQGSCNDITYLSSRVEIIGNIHDNPELLK